ncbi:hypothetical protein Tcan_09898 [Toxocara canis]|uniref:Uncharacterized protein n=1 Tax=Toxocara canis TaxID=6265 RepID=A0A0B2VAV7_TOXCA|nr:hypothetical protein Tcan_09898 [Toxocara canis]
MYESYPKRTMFSPAPQAVRDRSARSPQSLRASTSPARKAERPWRQRLADAARLRSVHGDDVGGMMSSTLAVSRARRSSLCSQNSGDELQSSLNALKSYVDNTTVGSSRYRRSSAQSLIDVPTIGENSALRSTAYPLATKYSTVGTTNYGWSRRNQTKQRESQMSRFMFTTGLAVGCIRQFSAARHRSKQRSVTREPESDSESTSGADERAASRERRLHRRRLRRKTRSPAFDGSNIEKRGIPDGAVAENVEAAKSEISIETASSAGQEKEITISARSPLLAPQFVASAVCTSSEHERPPSAQIEEEKSATIADSVISESDTEGRGHLLAQEARKDWPKIAEMGQSGSKDKKEAERTVELVVSEAERTVEPMKTKKKAFPFSRNKKSVDLEGEVGDAKCKKNAKKMGVDESKDIVDETMYNAERNNVVTRLVEDKAHSKMRQSAKEEGSSERSCYAKYLNGRNGGCAIYEYIAASEDEQNEAKKKSVPLEEMPTREIDASPESQQVEDVGAGRPQRNDSVTKKANENFNSLSTSRLSPHFISATKAKCHDKHSSSNTLHKNTVSAGSADELCEAGNDEYSAVAHFKPGKRKKPTAPVPGTWSGPDHEMNISQIKAIEKDSSTSTGNVVTILKTFSFCEAPVLNVRRPKKKAVKEINVDASLKVLESDEEVTFNKECQRNYALRGFMRRFLRFKMLIFLAEMMFA